MRQKKSLTVLSMLVVLIGVFLGTTNLASAQTYTTVTRLASWEKHFLNPRPYYNDVKVPLNTSYYIELQGPASGDTIEAKSVTIKIYRGTTYMWDIVTSGQLASHCTGFVRQSGNVIFGYGDPLLVYASTTNNLLPNTQYRTRVYASSKNGASMKGGYLEWTWTTEAAAQNHETTFTANAQFSGKSTQWGGKFFTGFTNSGFCVTRSSRMEFEQFLMDNYRKGEYPDSWKGHCGGFGVIGGDPSPNLLGPRHANSVRSLATRHIAGMQTSGTQRVLIVENFYGHEQYLYKGAPIPSNRPVSADYAANEVVLISDGTSYTTANVVRVHDGATTQMVIVKNFSDPSSGWKDYSKSSLPTVSNPNDPGLIPPGGLYLRTYSRNCRDKLAYFWDKIDTELDAQTSFNKRLVIRYHYESPDLNAYGKGQGRPKHYTEYWQAVYDITRHIIDRYGEQAKGWEWAFFGEPDWGGYPAASGGNWEKEIQTAYDYGADAVCRAYEDKWGSAASAGPLVSGPCYAALFANRTNQWDSFLAHCAPGNNKITDEIVQNACYNDPLMAGKRSHRTEALCSVNSGTGAPLDYLVCEGYGTSKDNADKMSSMTQLALTIDPVYYAKLPINNYWCAPNWPGFSDYAAQEALLSNGWYASWCADIVGRRLLKAQDDPRYATGGYSHMMGWGLTISNLSGTAEILAMLDVDDNADGSRDRRQVYNYQMVHLVNFLSKMKLTGKQTAFPEVKFDSFSLGGAFFESDTPDQYLAFVYAHSMDDIQGRSPRTFKINLQASFANLGWNNMVVKTFQIDKNHNSYNDLVQQYRGKSLFSTQEAANIADAMKVRTTTSNLVQIPANGVVLTPLRLESNGVNLISFTKANPEALGVEDFEVWE